MTRTIGSADVSSARRDEGNTGRASLSKLADETSALLS